MSNDSLNRRGFFKVVGAASVAGLGVLNAESKEVKKDIGKYKIASIIDLGLCDGCKDFDTPKCVSACRDKNSDSFPKPIENIPYYFPRKVYEDYSKNKLDTTRLTPYNWTYIESVRIDNKEVFIPRRCMHCDDPTCQKLCPFGVISKDKNGAVKIDTEFCFGGAKCRDACPWDIPQRQAGVGIYLKIAPKLAGGGAMFKCDNCADLLVQNKAPACAKACPKNAIVYGERKEIQELAYKLAKQYAKDSSNENLTYIYGDKQNGGTSTFYVSPIAFEKIDSALNEQLAKTTKPNKPSGRPNMKLEISNFVSNDSNLIKGVLAAPLVGLAAGAIAVARTNKKDKEKLNNEENKEAK